MIIYEVFVQLSTIGSGGMVRERFLQVFSLLFLAGCTNSHEWHSNMELPLMKVTKNQPEVDRNVVLDCASVQFYLATREDPNGTTKACLEQNRPLFNGRLNITKRTKILVHGWRNSRETDFTQSLTKVYLKVEDVNVIQVDWSKDAKLDYLTSAYRVPQVGYTLAKFIQKLIEELSVDVNKVDLIGFSLGSHVVGIAGFYTTPKVPLVIGLDPAGPLFETEGPNGKITTESGKFVVTLHTCKYRLGTFEDLGDLNFNANSGESQPGCWDSENIDILGQKIDIKSYCKTTTRNKKHDHRNPVIHGFCSHGRAPELLAASLIYPKGFLSTRCNNYLELELGMCDREPTTYFTGTFNTSLRGTYFFKTTSTYPFMTNTANERPPSYWPERLKNYHQQNSATMNPKTRNFSEKLRSAAKIQSSRSKSILSDQTAMERMVNINHKIVGKRVDPKLIRQENRNSNSSP